MKIAYDPQIFSIQIYGGVSRYFCEIASNIAKSYAVNVKIIAPFNVCKYLKEFNSNLIRGFGVPTRGSLKLFFRLCSMVTGHLYLLVFRPDIIHETYFFPYALGPRSAKRVLTVYDMIHEKFPDTNFSQDKTSRYKAIAVNRADHVICISETTKRDLIDLFKVDPRKVSVIYLGHRLNVAGAKRDSPVIKHLPNRFLLYVGQRGGYKNFKSLIAAYSLSENIRTNFDIVCFGGEKMTSQEYDVCNQMGISSEKVHHIFGADEVLSQLYRRASAFIYPSLYEGFGLPPLEAMNHDCVVICSNAGSIPEVVGDAGEYFDPTNAEDIKNAMEKVLFQPERKLALKALGRERLNKFSWDQCAEETMNLYKELCAH